MRRAGRACGDVPMFEKFDHIFDIKSVDKSKRIIRGIASLEEPDRDGEIIAMEAFDSSLKQWLENPVIRFKHQDPIGRGLLTVDGEPGCYVDYDKRAFIVSAYISDATQTANEAWGLMLDGVVKSFSVGGKVLEKEAIKQNGREVNKITKMELYEVSVVDLPSNRKSFFNVIAKSIKQGDEFACPYCGEKFDSAEKVREHEATCPKKSAKQTKDDVAQELFNKPYSELTDEEKAKVDEKLKPKEDRAAQDISKPGEGTHSDKWDRCVAEVRARGGVDSPEAVCTAQLGEESFRGLERGEWTEKDMGKIESLLKKIGNVGVAGHDEKNKKNEETKCLTKAKKRLLISLLTKLQKH